MIAVLRKFPISCCREIRRRRGDGDEGDVIGAQTAGSPDALVAGASVGNVNLGLLTGEKGHRQEGRTIVC